MFKNQSQSSLTLRGKLTLAVTMALPVAFGSMSCSAQTAVPGAIPPSSAAPAPKSDLQPGSGEDKSLDVWRAGVKIEPVSSLTDRHVIHAYYVTCPESPDGKYVLYFTSGIASGELGDLRIKERATGKETILVENIATEDAHRVACQQWSNNGKTVVYHEVKDGHWRVMAVDIDTRKPRVLAMDHQVGFGSPTGRLVPLYGCHWNPGPYRDLELVDCVTGETHTAVKIADAIKEYPEQIEKVLKTTDLSVFFPVMSPDEKKVFFKLSHPSGGTDFKSKAASVRDGKVVYDLENKKFLGFLNQWGHPSWTPDSQSIFEKGNFAYNVVTHQATRYARSCISDHPSAAPGNKFFVTDAEVEKRPFGNPRDWAVAVGSTTRDDYVVLALFDNAKGARTWRHNHPHPAISNDGKRIYFNVNDGPWTRLMVATVGDGTAKPDATAPIPRLTPAAGAPSLATPAAAAPAVGAPAAGTPVAAAPPAPVDARAVAFKAVKWDISQAGTPLNLTGYKMTFEDNFDKLSVTPDGGKGPWFAPIHTDVGTGKLMPPGPDGPFSVADGILTIRSKQVDGKWQNGMMQTVDSKGQGFVQQYGYFETRARFPVGTGSWAAFWLLSQNGFTDYTKTRTEIDVVEWYGADPKGLHATAHLWPARQRQPDGPLKHVGTSQYSNLTRWQERFKLDEAPLKDGQLVGWHTYGSEITKEWIIMYFDGHELARFPMQPEYHTPIYMLLDLIINPPEAKLAVSPLEMNVDYVRAYSR